MFPTAKWLVGYAAAWASVWWEHQSCQSEEPDLLLLKEHFTNLLNYRQLKASFRLSNLWLQGFVTSKLYMYFSFLYLYCHYKLLCITTSYLLYIAILLHTLMRKMTVSILFTPNSPCKVSVHIVCLRIHRPNLQPVVEMLKGVWHVYLFANGRAASYHFRHLHRHKPLGCVVLCFMDWRTGKVVYRWECVANWTAVVLTRRWTSPEKR